MLEQSLLFFQNKREFIETPNFSTPFKLQRLEILIDFFQVEEEKEILAELFALKQALRIKKILEESGITEVTPPRQ